MLAGDGTSWYPRAMLSRMLLRQALCLATLILVAACEGGTCPPLEESEAPGEVTFIVLASSGVSGVGVPLSGATVALDQPGGERVELLSGADGKVTFTGLRWSAGPGAVTAHLAGYALESLTGLSAERFAERPVVDGAVGLWLDALEVSPAQSVTVQGTLTGVVDPAHFCFVDVVNSMVAGQWSGPCTGNFSVKVPVGEPFTLQAHEVTPKYLPSGQGYQWPVYRAMQQTFDPITTGTTGLRLDLAAFELPLHTAEISVNLPADTHSRLRNAFPVGNVCAANSLYCFGWPSTLDISGDGARVEGNFAWLEPTWAQSPRLFLQMLDLGTGRTLAALNLDGYPSATLPPTTFLDMPRWRVPESPWPARSLYSPLEWQLPDPGTPLVALYRDQGRKLVWRVYPGKDATVTTLPTPPSSVDEATLLGVEPLQAHLQVLEWDESRTKILRFAESHAVMLQP